MGASREQLIFNMHLMQRTKRFKTSKKNKQIKNWLFPCWRCMNKNKKICSCKSIRPEIRAAIRASRAAAAQYGSLICSLCDVGELIIFIIDLSALIVCFLCSNKGGMCWCIRMIHSNGYLKKTYNTNRLLMSGRVSVELHNKNKRIKYLILIKGAWVLIMFSLSQNAMCKLQDVHKPSQWSVEVFYFEQMLCSFHELITQKRA